MSADGDPPASGRSDTAHLVLERRDGPQGPGLAYVAEAEGAGPRPAAFAISATFYPESDPQAGEAALRDLVVRLDGEGWQQEPSDPLAIIGLRFRRR
ncbi:MAG: hypothetical protein JO023_29885 [Chloroflexi bacterium]|nr:hypothetical protein [Chloroflexota bacterium]